MDELGADVSTSTTALFDEIRLAEETAQLAVTRLPSLIGRDGELQEIVRRLDQPNCRLICITGVGGTGKTLLAQHTAAWFHARLRDGATVVPLDQVSRVEDMAQAIGAALNWNPPHGDPWIQLLNHLGSKEILLVLDSWEHLRHFSDRLTDMVRNAAGVKLLVTSRERLPLAGAEHMPLGGLSVSSNEPDVPAAVQLFVERARRLEPKWQLTANHQVHVAQIARQLDGLPLAIELASGLIGVMDVAEIATAPETSLELLFGGFRDMPERHRSMLTVWDNSWRLLTLEEQRALEWLADRHGTFTIDSAPFAVDAVPATLAGLVDKALIRLTANGGYEVYPLLRQYAAGRGALHSNAGPAG